MKVCVLSGSPKGKYSITYHNVLFLEKVFPDCTFETLNVGQGIKKYERDFAEAKEKLEAADLILFCYPVYTFLVPYQLHRFVELMKENNVQLEGKCAAQLSTSKHFFDVTAHNFVKENCDDMKLHYAGGLSLDMEDMLNAEGREKIVGFWKMVCWRMEQKIFLPSDSSPSQSGAYTSTDIVTDKKEGKKVIVVSARQQDDAELAKMIADFQNICSYPTEVVELKDFPFRGGCLGCLNCAAKGKCVYTDGFDEFLRNNIQKGDCIVYAYRIKDHSMGSLMKLFDDRQFCNGHRTVTMGSPVGYLVLGDLTKEENLKTVMVARADVGKNFLAGIATDSDGVLSLCKTLEYALENNVQMPSTFYGVGGTMIFRDLIWLMRGIMKADYKFFKQHKMDNFPQKKRGTMIKMKLVGALISNPKIKAKMGNAMNEGMVGPYKKVLKKLDETSKM